MTLTPFQQDLINAKICPYCKSETEVTTETEIYNREYEGRDLIKCKNYPSCNSYVGCDASGVPLGRLADRILRRYRKQAHNVFDRLWKEKLIDRDTAYEELADHLELPDQYTHIGMFSKETCVKVIQWADKKYKELV